MANVRTYGINFPFRDSKVGQYLSLSQTEDEEIRSDLIHLLLTRKGSRYFLPDFGTRIYEYIFEPMDGPTFDSIKAEIREAVTKYIPKLQIDEIKIMPYLEDNEAQGEINHENLDGRIYRIPDRSAEEYTAKVKIEYTIADGTFESRDFIIINI